MKEKLAIICCLHGNEKYGLEVVKRLPAVPPIFIANARATRKNKRFMDIDMNRCFPGKEKGNYEERRALELNKKLTFFDYVIDLHSSSNECPLFGIITKSNNQKIELAKKLGLKRLVIIKEDFASGKSLIDFVRCGISLEIGPHEKKENIEEVADCIKNLLSNLNKNDNMHIYEVTGTIKKHADNIIINNFQEVKKGDVIAKDNTKEQKAEFNFIPVLVNEEAYNGILCLVAKRIN